MIPRTRRTDDAGRTAPDGPERDREQDRNVARAEPAAVLCLTLLVVVGGVPALVGLAPASLADAGADDGPATAGVASADDGGPVARCSASETTVAPGESVALDASGSENATRYRYDKEGDGSFGEWLDRETLDVTYEETGTYEPQVQVRSPDDFTDTASCGTVTVERDNEPPTVNRLGYSPGDPEPGETVAFEADASDPDGSIEAYEWRVDGEVVGDAPTFEYAFPEPGEYTVAVTVIDDDGATATAERTVTVAGENEPPSVDGLGYSPGDPEPGETVAFEADASDPDGSIEAYEWRVDGEVVGDAPTFEYAFPEPGEYTVAVTVIDDDGATATAERTMTVESDAGTNTPTPRGEISVTAEWWHSPLEPRAGRTVTLVADGPDDRRVTYRWDIDADDEVELEGIVVTAAFSTPGERRVTLQADGPDGETASRTATLRVAEKSTDSGGEGELRFWTTPVEPKPGQTVTLVADPVVSPEEVEDYRWDLDGDGETDARGRTATYAVPDSRDYTVTVETVGEDGQTKRSSGDLSASERPPGYERSDERRLSVWTTSVDHEPGQTVTLVADPAVSPEEVENYRWDLDGDGETDARGRTATYAFPEDGRYGVGLTVERTDGNTSVVNDSIAVGQVTAEDADAGDTTGEATTPSSSGGDGSGAGAAVALVALLGAALLIARRVEK